MNDNERLDMYEDWIEKFDNGLMSKDDLYRRIMNDDFYCYDYGSPVDMRPEMKKESMDKVIADFKNDITVSDTVGGF